jgi:hypothetical protein
VERPQGAAPRARVRGARRRVHGRETGSQRHLDEWTHEEWQTADGKPARRGGTTARYLPKKAWEELTPAERRATDKKKRAASKTGRQFVANTGRAADARRDATAHDGAPAKRSNAKRPAAKGSAAKRPSAKRAGAKRPAAKRPAGRCHQAWRRETRGAQARRPRLTSPRPPGVGGEGGRGPHEAAAGRTA